jgi:2-(1,2-epoxy-1,2-dihydrophenyl)acetyl-CoA isomerase
MAVDFEMTDGVGLLTLAQPDRLNPMNDEAWSAIEALIAELDGDDRLKAVVVTGAGRVFSAGGDINRMRAVLNSDRSEKEFHDSELARLRWIGKTLVNFVRLPVVRVAAVNRCAVGAGLALACACDYRIVGDDGFFDTSFARLGLPGDTGISHFLPQLIGANRAKDWLLRPRRIYGPEALRIGLVDEVVPTDELLNRARAVAGEVAAASQVAVVSIRQLIDTVGGLDAALDMEAQATVACKMSEYHKAAVAEFLEKHNPA